MTLRTLVATGATTLILFGTARLDATNGYFSTGYGTAAKGTAGAGVALATDSMAPSLNPASLTFIPAQIDLSAGVFNPNRSYEVTGNPSGFPGTFGLAPGLFTSGSKAFVIPSAGVAWHAGRAGSFGLAVYGNGGMNTNYNAKTFGVAPAGVNLVQMLVAPTWAHTLGANHSIGVTGLLAYQRFSATGLQAFSGFSSNAARVSNNDAASSLGGGLRVGYLGKWSSYLSVGASYQSRLWMQGFDKYRGLFAESGDFDIPSSWQVGLAVHPTASTDLLGDVQQVRYSEVNAIANPMLPNLMGAALGADGGAGFGWTDMTIWKFGVQQRTGDHWTWRAGYSFGDQPVPPSEVLFNILAPGVIEQHASAGFTRTFENGSAISLAVTRAFSHRVSGTNPLEVPGRQQIGLTMNQWDVQVGYTFRFRRP